MQRILIVDDLPDNLYFLEVLLKGNGFEVASALNGAEALSSALKNAPDLIVSDILMPEMDGYTLCREWRIDERLKSIPFIFYTATFTEKKDEELALSLGADRFIIKPQEPDSLMAVIREVLAYSNVKCSTNPPDDSGMLKEYSEALFRKLEKKMADLEQANRELEESLAEKKKLEEQLRQAQKMEAIGRFSAGIAHDFNNILTVIIGYGCMMRMKATEGSGQLDKLNHILEAADRAKNLTSTLLAFSRKQPVKLQLLEFNNVVSGIETFLRRVVGDDITVSITTATENIPVMADRGHLEQILMNLAVNAHDAMPEGGKLSLVTSTISIDEAFISMHGYGKQGRYALLSVSDTGVGMDADICQKIFEPFFTTKENGRGTGLGLAIVYGIVQQHNGHIHVYSEPGEGTTFRIMLPLTYENFDFAAVKRSYVAPPSGSETILVVDNEETIRQYLKLFLTTLGYTVYLASNGLEAVEVYQQKRDEIDLVIMDVIMPQKNGSEAALEIKKINENARIIFISGYAFDVINERHLLSERAELLMKPVSPSDLALKVREVLEQPVSKFD